MKIKAKLQIGAVLSIGITVVISIILFLASRQVDKAVQQSGAVQNIVTKVFESNLLLNDFLLRHEEQAESQWQENHRTLEEFLATLALDDAKEQNLLNQVRGEHGKTTALFSKLVEGHRKQRRNRDEIISFLDLEEKVAAELSSRSRAMVSHAAALSEMSQAKAMRAQRQGSILVVVLHRGGDPCTGNNAGCDKRRHCQSNYKTDGGNAHDCRWGSRTRGRRHV